MKLPRHYSGLRTSTRFLLTTFLITWPAWWLNAVLTSAGIIDYSSPIGTAIHTAGVFGPTIAGLSLIPGGFTLKRGLAFTFGGLRRSLPWTAAFVALAVLLSFWLSALYRAGGCAFSCCLLHALANTLIGVLSLSSISLVIAAALALTGSRWPLSAAGSQSKRSAAENRNGLLRELGEAALANGHRQASPLNRNAVPIQGARFFYMWTGVQEGAREATLRTPPLLDRADGLRASSW